MPPSASLRRHLRAYVSSAEPILKLPHPYQIPYGVVKSSDDDFFQLRQLGPGQAPLPEPLHNPSLCFTEPQDPKSGDRPHASDNTLSSRARRSPSVRATWKDSQPTTLAQLWLLTYTIFTIRPNEESIRLELSGSNAPLLTQQLIAVGLAINTADSLLLLLRSAFWQGAASPFGPRPAWTPPDSTSPLSLTLSSYPPPPLSYTLTTSPSTRAYHPRRPIKPSPSSLLYSRYIPHLRETFSMIALDPSSSEHLSLFHTWVNDPRVSQGWNQTGTLAQHKEYLLRLQSDPSRLAILAKFDDTFFAYFEVYWAKEDPLGTFYAAGDYDRGRHSLVGDVRYRGPHRVSAWWSSLMHYLFLDEVRTMEVVGEPQVTNSAVLMYDLIHGFGVGKVIDLEGKRAAFMSCGRERFFQLCPFDEGERVVGGTGVGVVPKL